jgi:hypothetical protein
VRMRRLMAASLLGGLSACVSFTYENTPRGILRGQLIVIWVGEDRFVYWPYTKDPLTFELSPSLQQKLGIKELRAGLHYTDGGSIPRALRALDGFSPWAYAPSYVFHDWVFAAHHCIVHGRPDMGDSRDSAEYEKVRKFSFEHSAALLAEVMKTLMVESRVRPNPRVFNAISFGVDSVVAKDLWNSTDPTYCAVVSDADKKLIEDAITTKTLRATARGADAYRNPPLVVHRQSFGY